MLEFMPGTAFHAHPDGIGGGKSRGTGMKRRCAYYIVVLKFILSHTSVGGGLLGFFFLPAIIFGAALVLIKIIKQCMENGNYNAVNLIFWLHIVFIIISAVFLVSMFV